MKIIYLKPLGGYASDMRSDTLWGMLCWGIRHLWGEPALTKFLENCEAGKPPFVISSAFPYKYPYDLKTKMHSDKPVPFFPNPLPFPDGRHQVEIEEARKTAELRKKYKKAFEFVCFDDFKEILNGTLTAEGLCDRLRKIEVAEEELKEIANKTGKLKEERIPSQEEINQTAPKQANFSQTHNTINRLRGGTLDLPVEGGAEGETAGQLFHSAENYWTDRYADSDQANTGIYFLADGDTVLLESVLRLFRHWGFGADRTSGKGFFDVDGDIQEIDFSIPVGANAMLNLSLLRPTPDELKALDGAATNDTCFHYNIEVRQGYVGGRALARKNAHRYFTEGSVFPLVKNGHLGGLIAQKLDPKIAPSHPVWDNGFGFMLPIKWQ